VVTDIPPSPKSLHPSQVRTSAFAGSLVPCGHIPLPLDKWNVAGCAVLALGMVRSEPVSLPVPLTAQGLYAATGARAALEFHVGGPVLLRIGGDLLAVLRPVGIRLLKPDAEVWTGGRVAASFGGGVVADF
jgi:hypothetical protein